MPIVKNFKEVHELLRPLYLQYGTTGSKGAYTLDRIERLLAYLGNPQNSLKVIHVAGTSGKTSTSYYIASLLKEAGAKVGLTVSPHIIEINDRVQINLSPMPEAEFCSEFGTFLDMVEQSEIQATYFELMVAFAYYEFAKQAVDCAVVEVGLGGLLDGTNVVSRADKVCVITDIGFDHTHVLGNTLAEIAAQKAGIIQSQNHVFMFEQNDEIQQSIHQRVAEKQATLHLSKAISGTDKQQSLPQFQERNFTLARHVAQFVLERDTGTTITANQIERAQHITVPGRMEVFEINGKPVVLDGAHNEQKMTTLLRSLEGRYGAAHIAAMVAFVERPDIRWQKVLDVLEPHTQKLIATSYDLGTDDVPKQSIDAGLIKAYVQDDGRLTVLPDAMEALNFLLQQPEDLLLITGSLYLVSAVRPRLQELAA